VPPHIIERADLRVAENVDQTRDRGQGRHHKPGAEQPNRRRRPAWICGLPVGDVADQGRNEKRNREWDEHGVNGMTRDARCAARVCHKQISFEFKVGWQRSDGKRVDATEGSERLFQQVETEGAKISYFCNTHRKDATEKNNLRHLSFKRNGSQRRSG
jgi:hypothetical protein